MSYTVVNANNVSVGLAGFAIVVPFDFNPLGSYGLWHHHALAYCHLVRNASNAVNYETPSAHLTVRGTFEFKNAGTCILKLNAYSAKLYLPCHFIGAGESVIVLQGDASVQNNINSIALPAQTFSDWGYTAPDDSLFAWKGEIVDGTTQLLKVCEVQAPISISNAALSSFVALGPTTDGNPLFSWLLSKGNKLTDAPPIGPDYTGGALPGLAFKDGRRSTNIDLFGGAAGGTAQVAGAVGAVLMCQGTYSQERPLRRLLSMAQAAMASNLVGGRIVDWTRIERAAASVLSDPPLDRAMSRDTRIGQTDQMLFQGMAVWGLGPRIANGQQEAALPPALL